jgi:hypothetical protein
LLRLIVIKQLTGWNRRRRCGRCQTSGTCLGSVFALTEGVQEELTMPKLGHRLGPGTAAESTRVVIEPPVRGGRAERPSKRADRPPLGWDCSATAE